MMPISNYKTGSEQLKSSMPNEFFRRTDSTGLKAEIAELRKEIAELKSILAPPSSIILTGDAVTQFMAAKGE